MIGKFSANLGESNVIQIREQGLLLAILVLVRLIANYWQQAFLWDAALNSVYKVKIDVFERVLQSDIGFFEGRSGVSAGDIAYRITAEASDVADTVYALLNVSVLSFYFRTFLFHVLKTELLNRLGGLRTQIMLEQFIFEHKLVSA